MGYSIGFDSTWQRDIGYGVPAICDHPGCNEKIDRGLSYVCGGDLYGGEYGCGLYFCGHHLWMTSRRPQRCARCLRSARNNFLPKPDVTEWINHKLTDPSWSQWRAESPEEVKQLQLIIATRQTDESNQSTD